MNLERWNRGLLLETFIEQMDHMRGPMARRVRDVRLTPFERNMFASLEKVVRVAVMTEDWCSDSLMNVPVLAQAARSAGSMEVRVFIRHEWPELRAYFEERGIKNIPIFWFLTEHFEEIGVWVERPKLANTRLCRWNEEHPQMEEIRAMEGLSSEEKRDRLQPYRLRLYEDMEDWYDQGLQSETAAEIRAVLKGYLDE
jgi:hypothetical protein